LRRARTGAAPVLAALLAACGGAPAPVEVPADLFEDPSVVALVERLRDDVEEDPASADARLDLGLALLANGAPDLAERELRSALSLDAGRAEAHFQIASILGARGDADGEREALEHALAADGGFLPAHYALGCALLDAGELDAAEARFESLCAAAPELFVGPLGLALVAEERGALDVAIERYERARALAPDHAYVRFRLGRAVAAAGETGRAAELLEGVDVQGGRPALSSPGDVRARRFEVSRAARLTRANALIRTGRGSEAVGALAALHRRDPDDLESATSLCAAYLDAGRTADARALAEDTIERAPREPLPRIQLASCLLETAEARRAMGVRDAGRAQLVGALESVDGAVAVAPEDPGAHRLRGTILAALRDDGAALEALRRAAALGGDRDAAYLAMRGPASRQGGADAVVAVLREAVAAGADGPEVRFELVRALAGADRAGEARDAARALAAAAPGSPWALRAAALAGDG